MRVGKFIVMEGTDGSGSTTQGDLLAGHLRQQGLAVVRTAQPSPLEAGQLIRRILRGEITGQEGPIDAAAVALLFAADRIDHAQRCVLPALAKGEWVVCDRHLASSLAFQVSDTAGQATPVDTAWVLAINRGALIPDLTLWLDVPVEVALERIVARGKPLERFETAATLTRVRNRYAALGNQGLALLGRFVRVDGTAARETVACAIRRIVEDLAESAEQ